MNFASSSFATQCLSTTDASGSVLRVCYNPLNSYAGILLSIITFVMVVFFVSRIFK